MAKKLNHISELIEDYSRKEVAIIRLIMQLDENSRVESVNNTFIELAILGLIGYPSGIVRGYNLPKSIIETLYDSNISAQERFVKLKILLPIEQLKIAELSTQNN